MSSHSIRLGTETENKEAQGFHEAFGFEGDTIAYYAKEHVVSDLIGEDATSL